MLHSDHLITTILRSRIISPLLLRLRHRHRLSLDENTAYQDKFRLDRSKSHTQTYLSFGHAHILRLRRWVPLSLLHLCHLLLR